MYTDLFCLLCLISETTDILQNGATNGDVFLAFGRVFSGVARAGSHIHVMSSAYNPDAPDTHRQTCVLGELFMMMGRGLERLEVKTTLLLKNVSLCSITDLIV